MEDYRTWIWQGRASIDGRYDGPLFLLCAHRHAARLRPMPWRQWASVEASDLGAQACEINGAKMLCAVRATQEGEWTIVDSRPGASPCLACRLRTDALLGNKTPRGAVQGFLNKPQPNLTVHGQTPSASDITVE